jgi:hypothetical protein
MAPSVPTVSAQQRRSGGRFCRALSEYYDVQFVIALASGFAEIGGEDDVDADVVRGTLMLGVSPKLAQVTEQMRAEGPRILRKDLGAQVRLFRRGVAMLEDLGVPRRVIRELAEEELDTETDPTEQLEARLGVTPERFEAAGRRYARIAEPVIEAQASSPKVAAAIELAANECGVFPDTRIPCSDLMDEAEIAAFLGEPATVTENQGCTWESAENAAGETSKVAIDVYGSTQPFERFVDQNELLEQVAGVGDEAVAAAGFGSATAFSSCGRTVSARAGRRTVQVAVCDRDREVTAADIAGIAAQVVERL